MLAARRNQLIITAESIVGRITARMEDVDSFIFDNLSVSTVQPLSNVFFTRGVEQEVRNPNTDCR